MTDTPRPQPVPATEPGPTLVSVDGFGIEYETDPFAHNRVEPADRGPGMDTPVHYTYPTPADKPPHRDVRVCDAVKAGDLDLVRRLVGQGLSVHQRSEQDWTALHFAAGLGDLAMVRLLVEELGADVTAVGRDRRRPSAIAEAAEHDEAAAWLMGAEKRLGVREDPLELRPYCKAYVLRDLRAFEGFREERINWTISPYWPAAIRAEFERPLGPDDIVMLHHDLQVTRSIWHGEHVLFSSTAPEWERFCREQLAFEVPDELR